MSLDGQKKILTNRTLVANANWQPMIDVDLFTAVAQTIKGKAEPAKQSALRTASCTRQSASLRPVKKPGTSPKLGADGPG